MTVAAELFDVCNDFWGQGWCAFDCRFCVRIERNLAWLTTATYDMETEETKENGLQFPICHFESYFQLVKFLKACQLAVCLLFTHIYLISLPSPRTRGEGLGVRGLARGFVWFFDREFNVWLRFASANK